MSNRDRLVLIGVIAVAVVGVVWLMFVSPERKKASQAGAALATAEAQLQSAHSELASARSAQAKYAASYSTIVHLGKAVPTTQEVPSLINELAQASKQKKVEFASIASTSSSGKGILATTGPSAAEAAAAEGGFQQVPFTFIFDGTYSGLEQMLRRITSFTARTPAGALEVNGRLLTIQGVTLQPVVGDGPLELQSAPDRHGHRDRLHDAARIALGGRRGRERSHPGEHRLLIGQRLLLGVHLRTPSRDRSKTMNVVTDYLRALREDLRDRRLLPLVVLAGVAMVGAIAFVVLGGSGGSSSSTTASTGAAATPPTAAETSGLALTHSNTSNAVAETTVGTSVQHAGGSRDPFVVLPNVAAAEAAAETKAKTSTSESSGGSSSGASSSSEPPPRPRAAAPPAAAARPPKAPRNRAAPRAARARAARAAARNPPNRRRSTTCRSCSAKSPPAHPDRAAGLTPYESLKLYTPLPSKEEPLVVFRGVTKGGKTATFTVAAETILQGDGKCLPSAIQCEAVQLQAGQTEQLQYLKAGTENVQSFELHLVSITSSAASKASVASIVHAQSKAGIEVLRRANLIAIPGLGMSSLAGVLVPTS